VRGQIGFESNDSVDEARLIGESDGLSGIERGTGREAAQRCEAPRGCGQRGLRRAGGAGEIGAHSDVGSLHRFQRISIGAFGLNFVVADQSRKRVVANAASPANQTAKATRTAQAGATPTRFKRKGRKFHVVMWT
jgi:hypothetical protein